MQEVVEKKHKKSKEIEYMEKFEDESEEEEVKIKYTRKKKRPEDFKALEKKQIKSDKKFEE